MAGDPHHNRFMSYLSLFTFFMLLLVSSGNFVQLFFGWEGVGLASYLLINFWFTRLQANKSALKAIIMNRFGDFFLSLALVLIYLTFKSLDFAVVFSTVYTYNSFYYNLLGFDINLVDVIALFLFFGAVGKSAQLGLHTWLPDAMEGPTPVSALIHAATMVTAGVFLLIRSSPLLIHSSIMPFLVFFGAATAFFAATVAVFQNDIKKIIAYSTCSQLGYMVFSCGLLNFNLAFFHLFNHAFFKALLFLGAGSVIHALNDEQDLRKMGSLAKFMPVTYLMILVGSLALAGFPFLTGFYSKDLIIENAFSGFYYSSLFAYFFAVSAAFLTAFYSFKLLYLAFFGTPNSAKTIFIHAHEPSYFMLIPLIVLGFASIFFGYLFRDMFIGLGTNFWANSIAFVPVSSTLFINAEFLPFFVKTLPLFLTILSFFVMLYFYRRGGHIFSNSFYSITLFFAKRWYFDAIYTSFISNPIFKKFSLNIGYYLIDRGLIETFMGSFGFKQISSTMFTFFSKFIQSGILFNYITLSLVFFYITFAFVNINSDASLINLFGLYFTYFDIILLLAVGGFYFYLIY
jgi:proton-translocating NADH-quinone oxidoreductase chain L